MGSSSIADAAKTSRFWLILVLALALALTAGLAGCGNDDEGTETGAGDSSSPATERNNEATAVSGNGDYELAITAVEYPYTTSIDPNDGEQFVKVAFDLTNTGGGYVSAVLLDFMLVADDGEEYTTSLIAPENREYETLKPGAGETLSGELVFNIPATATPVALAEGIGGEEKLIDLPAGS